ncbi:MAG: hypothetical protein GVY04_00470 [Cyanobacteria bacterium]|jgi:hypothetical protein|nr:hypothetical protein [Cyanobacteria bacterium GSL.Bin1]
MSILICRDFIDWYHQSLQHHGQLQQAAFTALRLADVTQSSFARRQYRQLIQSSTD